MNRDPYEVIRSSMPGYSKVYRKIAQYILDRSRDVPRMNIREMAAGIGVAESSIMRFCRDAGFAGFTEFKIELAKYEHLQAGSIYDALRDKSSEETFRDIFTLASQTLQTARDSMDYRALEALTDAVCRARRIVVCGVGASGTVAESFAVHLMRVGIPARASTDGELMQMDAASAREGDLFIGVSKGGRSMPLVYAFETARARGAETACIVGYRDTPLGAHCGIRVVHYCPTTMLMNCRIVQHTIIDCVYLAASRRRQEEAERSYLENKKAIRRLYVPAAREASREEPDAGPRDGSE